LYRVRCQQINASLKKETAEGRFSFWCGVFASNGQKLLKSGTKAPFERRL
jgi:hypothetical protein